MAGSSAENHLSALKWAVCHAALTSFECLLRAQLQLTFFLKGLALTPRGLQLQGTQGPATGPGKLPVSGDVREATQQVSFKLEAPQASL